MVQQKEICTIDSFDGEFRFLSNFYSPAPTVYDGVKYPTSEHAYQAAKTLNKQEREIIYLARTPGIAKRMGQKVTKRKDWEVIKYKVMYEVLKSKFSNPDLRQKLLETRGLYLVEGNHWGDTVWGECNGEGKNFLGRILMIVRDEL